MPRKAPKRIAAAPARRRLPADLVETQPPPDGVTDLSRMPVVMLVEDVGRVYRRAPGTIYRELRKGTFRGAKPYDTGRPFRWLRDDVEADLRKRRKHG